MSAIPLKLAERLDYFFLDGWGIRTGFGIFTGADDWLLTMYGIDPPCWFKYTTALK
jgi:hypothetical protein